MAIQVLRTVSTDWTAVSTAGRPGCTEGVHGSRKRQRWRALGSIQLVQLTQPPSEVETLFYEHLVGLQPQIWGIVRRMNRLKTGFCLVAQ